MNSKKNWNRCKSNIILVSKLIKAHIKVLKITYKKYVFENRILSLVILILKLARNEVKIELKPL